MERYESLGQVGKGSYGTVLKCRHRDSGRLVAIKKFLDSDEDKSVRKIARREIQLLRKLRHDNLVNLLDVWQHRRHWYLVFEFVERTLLDDLEQNVQGLDLITCKQCFFQVLRGVAFCHQQNVIHRDIKPENVLISGEGVVKLCDFGLARTVASPTGGGSYTDYVATRWYRAPELLVGDTKYSKPVDVWAAGCLLVEMLTGQPLFPGDSDLDQIYHIVKFFGNLTAHHKELFHKNPAFSGIRLPEHCSRIPLEQHFPLVSPDALDLAQECLQMDPEKRARCSELLEHPLFTRDDFHVRFLDELGARIQKQYKENTLSKIRKASRQEICQEYEQSRRGKDSKNILGDVQDKKNIRKDDEKVVKRKGKQLSKQSRTIQNTSEANVIKSPRISGSKCRDSGAKMVTAMKNKAGANSGLTSKDHIMAVGVKKTFNLSSNQTRTASNVVPTSDQHTSLSCSLSKNITVGPSALSTVLKDKLSKPPSTKPSQDACRLSRCFSTAVEHREEYSTDKNMKPDDSLTKAALSHLQVPQTSIIPRSRATFLSNEAPKAMFMETERTIVGSDKDNSSRFWVGQARKTTKSFPEAKKNDANASTIVDPLSVTMTPDHWSSTRSSLHHYNMDAAEVCDFKEEASLAPPPQYDSQSSMPNLLIPFLTGGAVSDHLDPRPQPGAHNLWWRYHSGVYCQPFQQPQGTLTSQAKGNTALIPLNHCCNKSDRGDSVVSKTRSDVHFPDVRSSVLPELREKEGKYSKVLRNDRAPL
uniref:cyclin-dependent kinase-like 2 isoform X2 n=1 Tax=Doryrhamphus excisus TaxID=161450 RepID=UPI0025AE9896|nr:cyclin-dependent kinase-like 2 isoform X2 [Doryrhamphus excisus]